MLSGKRGFLFFPILCDCVSQRHVRRVLDSVGSKCVLHLFYGETLAPLENEPTMSRAHVREIVAVLAQLRQFFRRTTLRLFLGGSKNPHSLADLANAKRHDPSRLSVCGCSLGFHGWQYWHFIGRKNNTKTIG